MVFFKIFFKVGVRLAPNHLIQANTVYDILCKRSIIPLSDVSFLVSGLYHIFKLIAFIVIIEHESVFIDSLRDSLIRILFICVEYVAARWHLKFRRIVLQEVVLKYIGLQEVMSQISDKTLYIGIAENALGVIHLLGCWSLEVKRSKLFNH